jgi:hypothetical protein
LSTCLSASNSPASANLAPRRRTPGWAQHRLDGEAPPLSPTRWVERLSDAAVDVLREDLEPHEGAVEAIPILLPRKRLLVRECALRATVAYCAAGKRAAPDKVNAGAIIPLAGQLKAWLTRPAD